MGPSQMMYHFRGAASDQKADEKELVERAAGDLYFIFFKDYLARMSEGFSGLKKLQSIL